MWLLFEIDNTKQPAHCQITLKRMQDTKIQIKVNTLFTKVINKEIMERCKKEWLHSHSQICNIQIWEWECNHFQLCYYNQSTQLTCVCTVYSLEVCLIQPNLHCFSMPTNAPPASPQLITQNVLPILFFPVPVGMLPAACFLSCCRCQQRCHSLLRETLLCTAQLLCLLWISIKRSTFLF